MTIDCGCFSVEPCIQVRPKRPHARLLPPHTTDWQALVRLAILRLSHTDAKIASYLRPSFELVGRVGIRHRILKTKINKPLCAFVRIFAL